MTCGENGEHYLFTPYLVFLAANYSFLESPLETDDYVLKLIQLKNRASKWWKNGQSSWDASYQKVWPFYTFKWSGLRLESHTSRKCFPHTITQINCGEKYAVMVEEKHINACIPHFITEWQRMLDFLSFNWRPYPTAHSKSVLMTAKIIIYIPAQ